DCGDDEPGRRVRFDTAAPDDMQLDPAAREPPQVVQRAGQITSEAVEVIHHDGPGSSRTHALGEAFKPLPLAPAHPILDAGFGELPTAFMAIRLDAGALVLQGDGSLSRLLRPADIANRDHFTLPALFSEATRGAFTSCD